MISEREVWQSAKLMINGCANDARMIAARRVEILDRDGDAEGAATWRAISRAIDSWLDLKPQGRVH